MGPGGHSSFPSIQPVLPGLIFTAASSLQLQLQHVEERCVQGQRRLAELQRKKAEMLEVLRVFEMIEENEKAKTKQLQYELERAEQEATERYQSTLGEPESWKNAPISIDDVFGPTVPNSLGETADFQPSVKRVHFAELNKLEYHEAKTKNMDAPQSFISLLRKQAIISLLPANEDATVKVLAGPQRNAESSTDSAEHTTDPNALLMDGSGNIRKRPLKKILALEKAKRKAAETIKTMPHKARRKLKRARESQFASKKTLASTGAAIRSMASGLGSIGSLWNSHQRLEDGVPTSETWPDAMKAFLSNGNPVKVIGADTVFETI